MVAGQVIREVRSRQSKLLRDYLHRIYSINVVYISIFEALETNYECVSTGTNYVSVACFWQLRTSVENFQVAVIGEEPVALLAGGLTNHAELHHVL